MLRRVEVFGGAFDFVLYLAGSFLEFLDSLAQAFGELRDFLCAEENENGGEHKKKLASAQTKRCKKRCHKN